MMGFQEYVPLSSYTTFKLGGQARYFSEALTADDVAAIASHAPAPLMVLGGGSNLIFRDGLIERCVMKMALKGFDIVEESADTVALAVGAGEDWDSVVARAVERGWSGLEALSAIPGTAGATPVQNVGAYGREIADVLIEARAYDLLERKPVAISRDDCRFAYRDSIFKQAGSGRFVITAVLLKLSKNKPAIPAYRDIHAYFAERQNLVPSLAEIRQAIIEVRSRKLPDPSVIASAGSFFKNPIVGKEQAEELLKDFP
ncbi:MAG TPA: FAD-binding protein, partial [Candidatus Paceibacterota bacterium]|nr:FAD-binding protein [Candidatus Paceibacterota bacterium]